MEDGSKKTSRSSFGYRRAVGLRYRGEQDQAPAVAVSGERIDADLLVRVARRFGVPVVDDAPLAKALEGVGLDRQIPKELYQAVAVVLSRLDQA